MTDSVVSLSNLRNSFKDNVVYLKLVYMIENAAGTKCKNKFLLILLTNVNKFYKANGTEFEMKQID